MPPPKGNINDPNSPYYKPDDSLSNFAPTSNPELVGIRPDQAPAGGVNIGANFKGNMALTPSENKYLGSERWDLLKGKLNKGINDSMGAVDTWEQQFAKLAGNQLMGQAQTAGMGMNSQAAVRGLDTSTMRSAGHASDELNAQAGMGAEALNRQAEFNAKMKKFEIQQSVSDLQIAANALYQSYLAGAKGKERMLANEDEAYRQYQKSQYMSGAGVLGTVFGMIPVFGSALADGVKSFDEQEKKKGTF